MKARITIIEDEPGVRGFLHASLRRSGFLTCDAAPCTKPDLPGDCDLQCCSGDRPDLIVLAVLVPRACSGIEAAHKALRRWPGVKILLTSASSSEAWPLESVQLLSALPSDSYYFLRKPFTAQQLNAAVEELLGRTT